jgi:hypothetical protein
MRGSEAPELLRIGTQFQFEVPDGWSESPEGSRLVYRGPQGEELIISSVVVDGHGPLVDRLSSEAQLLSNALDAAREGATQEGLVNTIPLRLDESGLEVPCWTSVSETPAKDALFLSAVARGDRGVLLATLEGPYAPELIGIFRAFLKSIRHPVS